MPRAVTLAQLRTRAFRLANLTGSSFASQSEATDLVNTHIPEVLAELSESGPPEYQSKTVQISTVAGTFAYDLTSASVVPDQDFGWLGEVYSLETADSSGQQQRRPIRSINPRERIAFSAPGGVCTVEIEYTPLPALLIGDGDTFDGLFGYEELVVALVARDMCIKQRQDYTGIQAKIDELRARIRNEATNRDKGQPQRVTDVDDVYSHRFLPGAVGIQGYRLRGNNLELYQPSAIWW